MNHYSLIAFDMDGTLLNTEKKISPETVKAIREAEAVGKIVILATGRAADELQEYAEEFQSIRYGILESGGVVYDFAEQKILKSTRLTKEQTAEVLRLAGEEDVMIQVMSAGKVYIQEDYIPKMAHYQIGYFVPLFSKTATKVPDIRKWLSNHLGETEKINLYHTDTDARLRTLHRAESLDTEKVYSELTSIEFSPHGVSKGKALLDLCEILHIDPEETIAVGDSDNDLALLKTAGLAASMGNANETIKKTADVIVADNDHDGCAEAIRRYLL